MVEGQLTATSLLSAISVLRVPILVFDCDGMIIGYNYRCQEITRASTSQLRNVHTSNHLIFQHVNTRNAIIRSIEQQTTVTVRSLDVLVGLSHRVILDLVIDYLPTLNLWTLTMQDYTSHDTSSQQAGTMLADGDSAEMLVRGLMHEINNPLGGIRAAAQLMAGLDDQEEREEFVTGMIADVDRIRTMLDQFRLLGVRPDVEASTFELQATLFDLVHSARVQHGEDIRWDVEMDVGLPKLVGDKGKLQQIVTNLLVNAGYFAKKSTNQAIVLLSVRTIIKPEGIVDPDFVWRQRRHSCWMRFVVEDSGRGLGDNSDQVFRPFYTKRSGGTGLGLALSRALAQQLGGRLWAGQSVKFGGAKFVLELPMALEI